VSQNTPPYITQYLANAISNHRLGHALLLLGLRSSDKERMALNIASALICKNAEISMSACAGCHICIDCRQLFQTNHANLHYIMSETETLRRQPEKSEKSTTYSSEIRVDAIRALKHEQHMSRLNETPHVWILIDGHHLTNQAANALLKTLEEPQNNQFFIILAPSLQSVLPTIASRCQRLLFPDTIVPEDKTLEIQAELFFEKINQADLHERFRIIEQITKNKETIFSQLAGLQAAIMKMIQSSFQSGLPLAKNRKQMTAIIAALEKAQTDLKAHINTQLVLEHLFLQSWPQIF
jgi:DNA polymerase III delta prime subunit